PAFTTRAQDREQRLTFEILHRDEVATVCLAEIVNVDDVRMLDECGDARLVEQHVDERFLAREAVMNKLDDDEFFESCGSALKCELHFGHAAWPDTSDELVST